ncbi:hypothetical protein [Methylocystis hirsuta]|uniref:RelA/SpoT domain-containing protein n=1 Tax=Methylocystis hirsuta TaxID=369798 RepID=A0A3M9XRE1_9HYPH|nr:hypothetical protein [Methylocystis hirsuta]RNJ50352.1 hypothetical protein D1O30_12890 [Methylocystis hirsuta]
MAKEPTLEYVDRYLETHGDEYEMLLENLKTFFKTHARLLESNKSIYRIYSRADKQHGRHFKDSWKIAQLISGGTEIEGIHDIIGITIVCPFNSDRDAVINLIKSATFSRDFNIVKERAHESPYEARHFVVCRPHLTTICCEIQIKTVFFDSWTVKSHDLTYKPEVILDPRYKEQMDVLAKILSALEKQSGIIKDMVEESTRFDKDKKKLAKKELMDRTFADLSEIEPSSSPSPEIEALRELQSFVQDHALELMSNDFDSGATKSFRSMVADVSKQTGYGAELCRIIAAVAVARPTNDMLAYAIEAIDRWKLAMKRQKPYPQACPYRLAAIILYYFGDVDRAIIEADTGLRWQEVLKGDDEDSKTSFAEALSAAAYYRAELGWPSNRVNPTFAEAKKAAEELITKALKLRPAHPALLDTNGFVKIAFATNESEAEAGLQQCRESWQLCRNTHYASVSDLYFEIDKRTAYRKVLSL